MSLRLLHYADVENAFDTPERVACLAGLLRQRRAADSDDATLVFGTGDNTGPGVLALTTDGEQSLDFFETVSPDASTLGNHDFDHGFDRTRELLAQSPQPWVVSNVETGDVGAGDPTRRFGGDHTTERVCLDAGDYSVGVVGILDPAMPEIAPHLAPLRFTDPVAAVSRHGSALRDAGADYLVVLSHAGDDCDDRIARETDADVILGGHTHVERVETVAGTLVTQPAGGGHHLIEVTVGGADAEGRPRGDVLPVADAPPEESLVAALDTRIAETGLDEEIDRVADPISRDRDDCREAESRVGNLVADAYRQVADADVGLVSPGFVRPGNPIGPTVRRLDLLSLAPYGGPLVVAELSGRRLRRVLEDLAVARTFDEAPADWFGHVSGVEVRWACDAGQRPDDDPGELVSATVGGAQIRESETYLLGTAEYHVVADHVFPALDEDRVVDRYGESYEAIVQYGREYGADPAIEGRVVRE